MRFVTQKKILGAEEPKDFAARLSEITTSLETMRNQLIALVPSSPDDDKEWLDMMSSRAVTENLGILMILSAKNAGWANTIVQQTLAVLDRRMVSAPDSESRPTMKDVISGVVSGQVYAEMSCGCSQCEVCVLRSRIGAEKAEEQLREMLLPKEKSNLVGPNGQTIH